MIIIGLSMNNTAMDICVQIFVSDFVFNAFLCLPRNGTAGSGDNSMFNFLFSRGREKERQSPDWVEDRSMASIQVSCTGGRGLTT